LHHGDCLEILRGMPDASVDAVVTDPPYGLTNDGGGPGGKGADNPYSRAKAGATKGGFMGLKWDSDVPPVDVWVECLRVLKPGAHLLAFAGTRTQHRMAARIEDAGFEIRDMIAWVYGSGFPKSRNLAGDWQGWGTALKPALEPITVARKPLAGTVAANVLEHGTGALNIDGCRVPTSDDLSGGAYADEGGRQVSGSLNSSGMNVAGKTVGREFVQPPGRWPANLIHDGSDEVLACFPAQSGAAAPVRGDESSAASVGRVTGKRDRVPGAFHADTGSAARFFYCAKASRTDRNEGVGGSSTPAVAMHATMRDREDADWPARNGNHHPTVKPTDLMRYLCRLVTPPGGLVLDPFMGSGSTGKAAMMEGFGFVGIEREAEYLEIARARINAANDDKPRTADLFSGAA
jgi:site-specific DNA-methyltransferase (adenine-specific)